MSRARRLVRVLVFFPVFLIVFAGIVWAVMALWNGLMPAIFGLRAITYWQALGLMVLSWILFRGFRGPSPARGAWRHSMRERFGRMRPEEREEFLKGMRSRWGEMRERWGGMTSAEREEFMRGLPGLWQDMLERWGKMTPSEREEFVRGLHNRGAGMSSPQPEPKA
jgi:predicted Fe-S protein YdhL (DUF1289 family)